MEVPELETRLVGLANKAAGKRVRLAFCPTRKLLACSYQRWVLGLIEPCVQVFAFEALKRLTPVCSMHESDVWHPTKFLFSPDFGHMAFSESDAFPPVLFLTDDIGPCRGTIVRIIDVSTWELIGDIPRKNFVNHYDVASMEDMLATSVAEYYNDGYMFCTHLYRGSYATWTLERRILWGHFPRKQVFVHDNVCQRWGLVGFCQIDGGSAFVLHPVLCQEAHCQDAETRCMERIKAIGLEHGTAGESWSVSLNKEYTFDVSYISLCGVQCNRPVATHVTYADSHHQNMLWIPDVGVAVCDADIVRVFAAPNVFTIAFMSPARAAWMCSVMRARSCVRA